MSSSRFTEDMGNIVSRRTSKSSSEAPEPGPGLNSMNKMRHHSDLTLLVGPSQRPFRVHKAILAKHSRFFDKAMRPHNHRSSSSSSAGTVSISRIEVPDLDEPTFPLVLEFLYSEKFPKGMTLLQAAWVFTQAAGILKAGKMKYKAIKRFCEKIAEEEFCRKVVEEKEGGDTSEESERETKVEDATGGEGSKDGEDRSKDEKKENNKGKEKVGKKSIEAKKKKAEEARSKFQEDLDTLCEAMIVLFTAYQNDDAKYFLKVLDVLKENGLLSDIMKMPRMRRSLRGNEDAALAVIQYMAENFKL